MGKIVAIGGGEIKSGQTLEIDRFVVELAEKERPTVLFVPTASRDAGGYINTVKRVYSHLGCKWSTLLFYLDHPDGETVRRKIEEADIIYVGGGNTVMMLEVWREHGVDVCLREAYRRGAVLAGLSAGSICWFDSGYSDSNSFTNPSGAWDYAPVEGLGLVHAVNCPHYNEDGREGFDEFMRTGGAAGIALDDCAAFALNGDSCRIVSSADNAAGYLLQTGDDGFKKRRLEPSGWAPLCELGIKAE